MADQRKAPIKKEQVAKAVQNRKVRIWGGVAIGVACLILAFVREDNTIALMLLAMVGFGVETVKGVMDGIRK